MLSCRQVAFSWPDGQVVVHGWTFSLNNKKWGLIGRNGAGKTTLLRLLIGDLMPSGGSIDRSGRCLWVSQFIGNEEKFSGGEVQIKRLLAAFHQKPDLLGLDEPTHHLDESHRRDLRHLIEGFQGTLVMISHDVDFLRQMDGILWIESGQVRAFPLGYDSFLAWQKQDQQERDLELNAAREYLSKTKGQRVENLERQRQRMRQGRREALRGGMPRILIGGRKRQAENSFAKLQSQTREQVVQAEDRFRHAVENRVVRHRPWFEIKDAISGRKSPDGRWLLSLQGVQGLRTDGSPLWETPLSMQLRRGDRLWLRGENGVGKSSLLQRIYNQSLPELKSQEEFQWLQWQGEILMPRLRVGYFRQGEIAPSHDQNSTFDCLRLISKKTDQEILDQLARFQMPLRMAQRPRCDLSGGEWMRSRFAEFLLADQIVELLLLDEPSHHLDLENREWLIEVLNQYPHAILFTSHEYDFGIAVRAMENIVLKMAKNNKK